MLDIEAVINAYCEQNLPPEPIWITILNRRFPKIAARMDIVKSAQWEIEDHLRNSYEAYLAKGEMKPSVQMCKKIASAFLIPSQEVMARVGMLDPIPPETASRREADYLFSKLSDEEQEIVLAQMRALVERPGR